MSAEALLPIAAVLSSHGGPAVQDIQKALWETLDEADDLSSCAGRVTWRIFLVACDNLKLSEHTVQHPASRVHKAGHDPLLQGA